MAITFISCIALVDALSAERTRVRLIEDLRFDTRSPSGWTLLLCLIAIPLSIILLVVRFLDLKFIINNRKIFLIVVC